MLRERLTFTTYLSNQIHLGDEIYGLKAARLLCELASSVLSQNRWALFEIVSRSYNFESYRIIFVRLS